MGSTQASQSELQEMKIEELRESLRQAKYDNARIQGKMEGQKDTIETLINVIDFLTRKGETNVNR